MIPLRDDNPSTIKPVVTIAFVVLCVVVFLWQFSLGPARGEQIIYSLGVIPAVLLGRGDLPPELALVPPAMTTLTSMFMHGGWMHLIGNMLYLWIFGDNVEDSMGHVRFAVFYVLCGLAAVFAQALPEPGSTIPMVGASGAISGVLGAYLLLFPHARVLVAIPLGYMLHTTRIPAGIVLRPLVRSAVPQQSDDARRRRRRCIPRTHRRIHRGHGADSILQVQAFSSADAVEPRIEALHSIDSRRSMSAWSKSSTRTKPRRGYSRSMIR